MTYLQFLLVFLVPPILLLTLAAWAPWSSSRRPLAGTHQPSDRRTLGALLLLVVVVLVWTTPWDNYLVWKGVWFYGQDRVLGTIGYVPIEEYLFFLLQPLLVGLWLLSLLRRRGQAPPVPAPTWPSAAAWFAVSLTGFFLWLSGTAVYLGLILAWAALPLAGQRALAGNVLSANNRLRLLAVGVPTLYFWVADAISINRGIWEIASWATVGVEVLGLPLEEALFFLLTNLLVVDGLLLFTTTRARSAERTTSQRTPV